MKTFYKNDKIYKKFKKAMENSNLKDIKRDIEYSKEVKNIIKDYIKEYFIRQLKK